MVRRLFFFVIEIIVTCFFANTCSDAQPQPVWIHQLPRVILDEQARYIGPLPGTQLRRGTIMLPLLNESEMDSLLQSLHDPQEASYRTWLSVHEFTQRFGPTREDRDCVIRLANTMGLKVVGRSNNGLVVDVSGSAATIWKAFGRVSGMLRSDGGSKEPHRALESTEPT
jgi:hypothetical protein